MRGFLSALTVSVSICVLCVPIVAQQDRPGAFDAIRSSASYRQAVLEVYQDYESSLSTHCAKIEINMNTSQPKVYGSIEPDTNGNIVNAHWKEITEGSLVGRSDRMWHR